MGEWSIVGTTEKQRPTKGGGNGIATESERRREIGRERERERDIERERERER